MVEGRGKKVDGRGRSLSDSVPKTGVFGRNQVGNRRQHGVVSRRPLAAATRWRPSAFGWSGVAATRKCLLVGSFGSAQPERERRADGSMCSAFHSRASRSALSRLLSLSVVEQSHSAVSYEKGHERATSLWTQGRSVANLRQRFVSEQVRIGSDQRGERETDLERHHDLCECLFAQRSDVDEQEAVKKRTESGVSYK